ncbi:MAG: aminotransferase class I/II-fold pyridoxal phosphate-dependent enzyme, partial [Ligilactobacillus saerimneri]|nr:aminotransferase class I/II-fold pyridoxal phosphate-dependent enzyme [Ligilactobacillus saerimneri]
MAGSKNYNKTIEKIAVSDIRQFDSEASQLPGIIKLTLGEPDFNTPEHIKEAAIKAIQDNKSHYTPNAGIPELRAATAKYF